MAITTKIEGSRWRVVVAFVLLPVLVALFWGEIHHHVDEAPPPFSANPHSALVPKLLERLRSRFEDDEFDETKDLTAPHAVPVEVWSLPPSSSSTTDEGQAGHDFATACLAEGKPRVIRNSPVKAWPAMRRWAPDEFAASLGTDGPLKVHVSGLPTVRMHSGVQPMGTLPGLEWHRPWTEETMTSDEFLALSRGNKGGDQRKFAYFFSNLDALPASVQADVGDRSFLTVGWRLVWETNVWVGGPLIRTPTHYDLLHNFYVQVQGHKRFRLYSPEQWPYLYLFPRLHPSTRMSQVDPPVLELQFGVNVSAAFPDHAKLRPHEVVLHPGDVLYLPPYWFHEVTVVGDDVSISVSVHTESDEVGLREALMQHPIPVQKDWPTDIKIKALAHYLHLVTADPLIKLDYTSGNGTQGPDGGNRFIAALVKTRYAHFGLDPWVDGLAAGVDEAERKWHEIERWELGREDDAEGFALCLDNAELGRHLERHASDLKQKLGRWISTPHAHVEMGNWVEDISAHLLGDPLSVGPFLRMLATHPPSAAC